MEKIMNLFKNYFKERKITFFVGLGFAFLSLLTGILYLALLSPIKEYTQVYIFFLLLLGALSYAIAGLFRYTKIGAFIMTLLNFISLIAFILTIYDYPITQLMTISNFFDVPHIGSIIVLAVLWIVITVGGNVLCWMKLDDAPIFEEPTKGENLQ